MSTVNGSPSRGVGHRTKLRKGTHSCLECKIRKTRCVPRVDAPHTCVECFSRGVRCRGQDSGPLPLDDRPNLKERVAKLEHLLKTLQSASNSSQSSAQAAEGDAVETLSNMRAEALHQSQISNHKSDIDATYDGNTPLLLLLDNTILARNNTVSNIVQASPLEANLSGYPITKSKWAKIRQEFLFQMPSAAQLDIILEAAQEMWGIWQRMFPGIEAGEHQTIKQYIFWCFSQENPSYVAMGALCLASALEYLGAGLDKYPVTLPLPLKELVNHYSDLADRLIIADDEIAATAAGLDILIVRAKCHFDHGRPRKCWLLWRRVLSTAQLLGLTRNQKLRLDETPSRTQSRLQVWRFRYSSDRYMSLLLGLPYAVADGCGPDVENLIPNPTPYDYLHRKLYCVVGRIIDRNQASSNPPLLLTLEIDQQLEDIVKTMPESWWDIEGLRAEPSISTGEYFKCLLAQFWFFQTRSLLHLPFVLQPSANRRVEYSRMACFHASREMLRLYHVMRGPDDSIGFHMCNVINFQGFTAAAVLLLGLLRCRQVSSETDLLQDGRDLRLIQDTMEILRRTSEEEENRVVVQSLQVLEKLSSIYSNNGGNTKGLESTLNERLTVPCFGTITISANIPVQPASTDFSNLKDRGEAQIEPICKESHVNGLSKGDLSANNPLVLDDTQPNTFNHPISGLVMAYPHMDVDWQSLTNVDLDENWNFELSETMI